MMMTRNLCQIHKSYFNDSTAAGCLEKNPSRPIQLGRRRALIKAALCAAPFGNILAAL